MKASIIVREDINSIFTPGNLVQLITFPTHIVLVVDTYNSPEDSTFYGVRLAGTEESVYSLFVKEGFKQFQGTITLSTI